jgi:ribosomal protein S17
MQRLQVGDLVIVTGVNPLSEEWDIGRVESCRYFDTVEVDWLYANATYTEFVKDLTKLNLKSNNNMAWKVLIEEREKK